MKEQTPSTNMPQKSGAHPNPVGPSTSRKSETEDSNVNTSNMGGKRDNNESEVPGIDRRREGEWKVPGQDEDPGVENTNEDPEIENPTRRWL